MLEPTAAVIIAAAATAEHYCQNTTHKNVANQSAQTRETTTSTTTFCGWMILSTVKLLAIKGNTQRTHRQAENSRRWTVIAGDISSRLLITIISCHHRPQSDNLLYNLYTEHCCTIQSVPRYQLFSTATKITYSYVIIIFKTTLKYWSNLLTQIMWKTSDSTVLVNWTVSIFFQPLLPHKRHFQIIYFLFMCVQDFSSAFRFFQLILMITTTTTSSFSRIVSP